MNLLGICGSHRKTENTFKALDACLKASHVNTEIIHISAVHIEPCRACYHLCSQKPYTCVIKDDLNKIFQKMVKADGIVLASPLYSPVLIPSRLAALVERLSCLYFFESETHGGKSPLLNKPCGMIAVSGGSEPMGLLKLLATFGLMLQLDVVTLKEYPYFGVWVKSPVEDHKDITSAQELGKLMAKIIQK